VNVTFKNLVGPGHPRPYARHCLSIYEKRLAIYIYTVAWKPRFLALVE